MTLEDKIDHTVGILLNVKIGDTVEKDDTLMKLYVNKKEKFNENDFTFIEIN